MRKLFRSVHKITQGFGLNPSYYKQFGLAGHEGIDLIPSGTVWDVLALADGVVVRDENNTKSGAYGNYVTIWHPTLYRATQYCHLASNDVTFNQKVAAGQKIGVMGASGNTSGAHVHLNLFETNADGVRQNTGNGYFGGIDPLPFLTEGDDTGMSEELKSCHADREKFWKERDAARAEIEVMKGTIEHLNDMLGHREREKTTLTAEKETLEAQLGEAIKQRELFEKQAEEIPELRAELQQTQESRQAYIEENVMLHNQIATDQKKHDAEITKLLDNAPYALVQWVMRVVKGGGGK